MMLQNNEKVFFITNIPTPYRKKQFSALKKRLPNLKIFFLKKDMEDRDWDIAKDEYYFYLDKMIEIPGFGILNKNLFSLVQQSDILILGGYDYPTYIALAFLAILLNKRYILLFDGIAPSRLKDNEKDLKIILKRYIANNAIYVLANGEVGKLYCKNILNVSSQKIYNQYLSIDNRLFSNHLHNKEDIKYKLRTEFGIDNNSKVILYSGRFIERKNIIDILKAVSLYPDSDNYTLLLLGSGENREELQQKIEELKIHVYFPGFIDENNLYKYYFISDILVLPSKNEPWGLVVNEALASEIPIVVSSDVGASLDLIVTGINGYIFEVGDIKDLSNKIKEALLLSPDGVHNTSIELLKKWNIDNSAKMISEVVQMTEQFK